LVLTSSLVIFESGMWHVGWQC